MIKRTMYSPQKDSPATSLTVAIGVNDSTFTVDDETIFESLGVPFPLTIGFDMPITEKVMVTDIDSNQLTVTRSSPREWPAGTNVARVFNADDLTAVQENLTDAINQLNSSNKFVIKVTFGNSLATGTAFSINGGSLVYDSTIPSSHLVYVPVPTPNAIYEVTCNGIQSTVYISNYYGIFSLVIGSSVDLAPPTNVDCPIIEGYYGVHVSVQATCTSSLPVTWSMSGLPSGFTINTNSGVISGMSATGITGVFTVTATNDYGSETSAPIDYVIWNSLPPEAPSNLIGEDIRGTYVNGVGIELTVTFYCNQNRNMVEWTVTGLPSWCSVLSTYVISDVAYCLIGGTPTASSVDSSGQFTVTATNNVGSMTMTRYYYVKDYILYGFHLAIETSDPDSRVYYIDGTDNKDFSPAYMDYSNDKFNYGDWEKAWFMPKPCMVKFDGTVDYFLDPNDYTKKVDGSPSDIDDYYYNGSAMMQWPKIWVSRTYSGSIYSFRIAPYQVDSTYDCINNYDINNNQIPYFYTGIYQGNNTSSKIRSLSGLSITRSTTASNFYAYAQANGSIWYSLLWADYALIQDLLIMLGKSSNVQTTMGQGSNSSSYYRTTTGAMDTFGQFYTSDYNATNGTTGRFYKHFGMEDVYGNYAERCLGYMSNGTNILYKLTPGTHDGTSASDFNLSGSGYLTAPMMTGTSGAYITTSTLITGAPRIPLALGGGSTTYDCDYGHYTTTSGTYDGVLGGYYSQTSGIGPNATSFITAISSPNSYMTTRLSCRPTA